MHQFQGKWISNATLASLRPRNVFHRQLDRIELDCSENRDRHVLFRRRFTLSSTPSSARLLISADDYYKLYINGRFVAQGPTPAYHFRYHYNELDVTPYLSEGENLIAVHTLYQGLINRVWQSGDNRHGLLCDLEVDGKTLLCSDGQFRVATHTGYTELGVCGYQTQFLERYDCRAAEVGFERPDFDDSEWESASICRFDDHVMAPQISHMLEFESILPQTCSQNGTRLLCDFGAEYVGYLSVSARGRSGDRVTVRCAQELSDDGTPRYRLRANCDYEEEWILIDGESRLDWFDYKAFRYAELILPDTVEITDLRLIARHYPFTLAVSPKAEFSDDPDAMRIWSLCLHTLKYGVQEVIQDCMEREKGFYLGDGCYTAFTHTLLTGDDSMTRRLIDDAFSTSFITDTLVTCMNCSMMQEIAEYPLMLVYLVLWHYRYTGDTDYLYMNYSKVVSLLNAYRRAYEREGLLRDLDKWCVVEWPKNFRHGYDVDLREGQVCTQPHISINAYYIAAVRAANRMADLLGLAPYRDEKPLTDAFYRAFYDPAQKLFRDARDSDHVSLVGNVFPYAFDLCPDAESKANFLTMLDENGIDSLSLFCTFPVLMGLLRDGETDRLHRALLNDGAWLRMLKEGATATFEGWGKELKWNTSLFHLTMSYAALFMADADLKTLLN